MASAESHPDGLLEAALEQAHQVTLAVADLPPEQASVIRSSYFEGRTLQEIAASESLPLGTVKTRARLALVRLRRVLHPGDDSGDGGRDANGDAAPPAALRSEVKS